MFNGLRLLLVIVLVQGCPLTAADKPSPADKPLADAKPDFTFTAEAWHAEFKKDEAAARTKYLDKVIEVKGVVRSVDELHAQFGLPAISFVYLEVPKDSIGVCCECTPPDLWKTVMPDSNTTVRGRFTVNSRSKCGLVPCVVVKTDGKPITFTAAAFAAEVAKNLEAADKKYDKKWVIIEGKFKSMSVSKNGVHSVVLESGDKVSVECGVSDDNAKPLKALKAPQAVKVFGMVNIYNFGNAPSVALSYCRVFPEK